MNLKNLLAALSVGIARLASSGCSRLFYLEVYGPSDTTLSPSPRTVIDTMAEHVCTARVSSLEESIRDWRATYVVECNEVGDLLSAVGEVRHAFPRASVALSGATRTRSA